MRQTYAVTLYVYTLMSNHFHLLLQGPKLDALGQPLRWFLTQTAKAFTPVTWPLAPTRRYTSGTTAPYSCRRYPAGCS